MIIMKEEIGERGIRVVFIISGMEEETKEELVEREKERREKRCL